MYTLADVDCEWRQFVVSGLPPIHSVQWDGWIEISKALEEELGGEKKVKKLPPTTPLGPKSQEAFSKFAKNLRNAS